MSFNTKLQQLHKTFQVVENPYYLRIVEKCKRHATFRWPLLKPPSNSLLTLSAIVKYQFHVTYLATSVKLSDPQCHIKLFDMSKIMAH